MIKVLLEEKKNVNSQIQLLNRSIMQKPPYKDSKQNITTRFKFRLNRAAPLHQWMKAAQ